MTMLESHEFGCPTHWVRMSDWSLSGQVHILSLGGAASHCGSRLIKSISIVHAGGDHCLSARQRKILVRTRFKAVRPF